MKRAAAFLLLASSALAADPAALWREQREKTRQAIAAIENATGDYEDSTSAALEGDHAKAVLKKQKERLEAIAKGEALAIPSDRRSDYAQYPTRIDGEARIFLRGDWRPLAVGFPLKQGDRLRVAARSRATLWLNGGFLTLGPGAEAQISEDKVILLTAGLMHWENLTAAGKEWQCRTPGVNAAIKGTEFDMELRGKESVFSPVSGVVELRALARLIARAARTASAGASAAFAPAAASRLSQVRGDVQVRRGRQAVRASAGAALERGDVVETGASGRATLALEGGFTVEVSPRTTFELEKRSYSLLAGLIRVLHDPADGAESDWTFRTPRSVAAVRGTAFKLAYSEERGREEYTPESGALEVSTKRDRRLKDLDLWWNKD